MEKKKTEKMQSKTWTWSIARKIESFAKWYLVTGNLAAFWIVAINRLPIAIAVTVAVVILIYEFTMSTITIYFSLMTGLKSNRSNVVWLPKRKAGECGSEREGEWEKESITIKCVTLNLKLDTDMSICSVHVFFLSTNMIWHYCCWHYNSQQK